ncbi:efflux RND transporter periplasmic adaptor subunit [Hyphobacterium sp. HN65]|uniref:Efflux RND transporter periplasmic adaptor subunit n=1 Tax=Hyphobacterium lacteum TaxID=3116575 RepID=A0ABU7LM52_9PROT|nr:efflux RND transporter periplasmic adaptor subunit [Hyphobacterium sp. HN65]MEE2524972.1 efflux RND transporter periplasmic adaptor subunit [Hyphobacterium sp. HN65]
MFRFVSSAVLAVMLSAGAMAQQGPPPANVRVTDVVEADMAPTIQSPATVLSRRDSEIAAEASGRIVFVAEPGDLIEAGEPVARIDDTQARLQLGEARARLARLRANADYQSSEYDRWSRLVSAGTAPETRLREVELARNLAIQEQTEARSAVQRAQLELDRTEILAPFSGRIVERLIEVGEYSTPGRDIVRLVDTGSLEARSQAPISVAPFLTVGDTVQVGDGERRINAPIRAIIPVGDSTTRTFEVRVALEDSPWIAGAGVRVYLPRAASEHVVAVPQDAIVLRSAGSHVWIVGDDNTAQQVSVVPGSRNGDLVAVTGELSAGDRVVVRGAERLTPGQTVNILEDTASNSGAATGGNSN